MHSLHVYLVKGANAKEARYTAFSDTECAYGQAFDWREDGPGRWEDIAPIVLSIKDEPEKARWWLEDCLRRQQEELDWYKKHLPLEQSIEDFLNAGKEKDIESPHYLDNYYLTKTLSLIQGRYMFESCFLDVENWDASLKQEDIESILDEPENLYLVFADLHF